jgi:hypothetical protein
MSTLRASMLDRTVVVEALERKPPGVPRNVPEAGIELIICAAY